MDYKLKLSYNIYMNKTKFILITIASESLAILLIFVALILTDSITALDKYCFNVLTANRTNFFNWFFVLITFLGETKVIVLACLILLCLPNRKKVGIPVILAVIASATINFLLKIIFQRQRPEGYFLTDAPLGYPFPSSFSFPSGHSQTGTVFYFALNYFLCKNYYKKPWIEILSWSATVVICLLICISRIYLGVHFFSDVVCGLMIAIAIISVLVLISTSKSKKIILNKNKQT